MGKVIPLPRRGIAPEHDGELAVATGRSVWDTAWRNGRMSWSALLTRLSSSVATPETHAEYLKMTRAQQDRIKDIGGFVGGELAGGRRSAGTVRFRQLLTLDLDYPPENLWDALMSNLDLEAAMAVYSTHKHGPGLPRYRLIMPLSRPVTPEEYEAVGRKAAEAVGIEYFDDSTYQPSRLMFWPSHSRDVEPVFHWYDAPFLDADAVLAQYADWRDVSTWPVSSRQGAAVRKRAEKQGDPEAKKGAVGAFCRTYSVPDAMERFLPGVYEATAREDRYTYTGGSTSGGLVLYDGGKFAYSNHATDPASGQLCNAFDLVRIHRFGELDADCPDRSGKDAPSYKAMMELVDGDGPTKRTIVAEQASAARLDFGDETPEDDDWQDRLITHKGVIQNVITNASLILEHDPALRGIRYNELTAAIEVEGPLPWKRPGRFWRDADDAQLYIWVSEKYGVQFPENRFTKALVRAADRRRFNPLQDYVRSLPDWDETPRVDTLLTDYLGADDTPYTRAVTRKTLIGAIQRVWEPGCKFDTVLVLDGPPGIGKSTLLRRLGGEWFSDSLSLADTRDKTAAEKLQGVWIMEIGELQGLRKADADILKGFLSRQVDEYRAAYGRVVERHPRTAILCGTTNSTTGFLRDTTGNRRFWPVFVRGEGRLSVWEMTEETRAQIWAEAAAYAAAGEESFLDPEMEREAARQQQAALQYDEREGLVTDYLDTLLPEDWYTWPLERRVDYFASRDELQPGREAGVLRRTRVSAMEIFCECFGKPRNTWQRQDSNEIASIMARLPEWDRPMDKMTKSTVYGLQRVYVRRDAT